MKKRLFLLIPLLFFMTSCGNQSDNNTSSSTPLDNTDNSQESSDMKYKIYLLAQNSGYNGTYEDWLNSIRGDQIVLTVNNNILVWKYSKEDNTNFRILLDLSTIKGDDSVQYYPVVYRNDDGSFYDVEYVEKGKSCSPKIANKTLAVGNKKADYIFIGWDGASLENIQEPTTVYASYSEYAKYGTNKVYFGSYPQTLINSTLNAPLVANLNNIAGALPTSSNKGNWIDYNYYINGNVSSYMYYQDIDYDLDGDFDYRGVYFNEYRPGHTIGENDTDEPIQSINGYSKGLVYWFSFDPIEWDILKEENGKALVIANLILDCQEIFPSDETNQFNHNGGTGYANNYALSNIRKFINNQFYNDAFNNLQKEIIQNTIVDNSKYSTETTSNIYACNDVSDKMFLLSYREVISYFTTNTMCTKATDYAKCQGALVDPDNGNSNWFGRSPKPTEAFRMLTIKRDYTITYFRCYDASCGLRPACWIEL